MLVQVISRAVKCMLKAVPALLLSSTPPAEMLSGRFGAYECWFAVEFLSVEEKCLCTMRTVTRHPKVGNMPNIPSYNQSQLIQYP